MRDLPDVLNWRRVNGDITLSGQPSEAQLGDIRDLGVTHIVNLGPHDNKGALPDEAGSVAALGMTYIYIPVDFQNPRPEDFAAFCAVLAQTKGKRVHVHCIYNARVTAFFYRYAQTGIGGAEADAFALMDGIWRPGGVWAAFIGKMADVGLPNRWAGDDYQRRALAVSIGRSAMAQMTDAGPDWPILRSGPMCQAGLPDQSISASARCPARS